MPFANPLDDSVDATLVTVALGTVTTIAIALVLVVLADAGVGIRVRVRCAAGHWLAAAAIAIAVGVAAVVALAAATLSAAAWVLRVGHKLVPFSNGEEAARRLPRGLAEPLAVLKVMVEKREMEART